MSRQVSPPTRSFRLHVETPQETPLSEGAAVALSREAAHYVATVMRARPGVRFLVFNSRDGEWVAELTTATKREASLRIAERTRLPSPPPDLWLLFTPIKKARTDFIVEKACELGCRRVLPVITTRTQSDRVNTDRLRAHAVEAAEQCGLVFVPDVAEPQPLFQALEGWEPDRTLYFCDESRLAPPFHTVASPPPAAILIGPEGGFAPDEADRLKASSFVTPVALGPRVLRADTAAAAAIAVWQAAMGDWRADAPGAS